MALPFNMYSLILDRRRLDELQKWRHSSVSVKLLQNGFAFSNSFSSTTAADVSLTYDSVGLTAKLGEPISRRRKVGFEKKAANHDSVLNLFKSYGFTDSQISSIITDYPGLLLIADAEKSIGTKLQFLKSRGASRSELTEILSTVPKILGMKGDNTISVYYDFVKAIIEADKSSNYEKLWQYCLKAEGSPQENKFRNISVLRELGVPQRLLFSLLLSDNDCYGKERFEERLKKVVEMGFDPTTSKFVKALRIIQGSSEKAMEEKVNAYKRLGFAVDDIWAMFKKHPACLALSEKKILNSFETFIGLGFSRDEFVVMVKRVPQCLGLTAETVKKKTEFVVKKMNWPLKAVVLYPWVLTYNMEKKIVPRCNVIRALMSKELLKGNKLPPMGSVFTYPDQMFLNRYVRKHDDKELVAELMAIFNKDGVS